MGGSGGNIYEQGHNIGQTENDSGYQNGDRCSKAGRRNVDEMPKTEQLDKHRVLQLLAEADTKWLNSHSGQHKYREHLEFTADYIAKNYDRKSRGEKSGSHDLPS